MWFWDCINVTTPYQLSKSLAQLPGGNKVLGWIKQGGGPDSTCGPCVCHLWPMGKWNSGVVGLPPHGPQKQKRAWCKTGVLRETGWWKERVGSFQTLLGLLPKAWLPRSSWECWDTPLFLQKIPLLLIRERESKRKTKMRPDYYLCILQVRSSVLSSLIISTRTVFSVSVNVYDLLHSLHSHHGLLAL